MHCKIKFLFFSRSSVTLLNMYDKYINLVVCTAYTYCMLLHDVTCKMISVTCKFLMHFCMMLMSVSRYMKMMHGNKNHIDVYYQNVPGTLSHDNKIATIKSLLCRENPDLLAVAEPTTDDLDVDWDDYTLLPGSIKSGKICRLNVLIKNDIKFSQTSWAVDIPHCIITAHGWTYIMIYREWAHCGDQSTKSIDHQLTRWQQFVTKWSQVRGKNYILLGDCNFDFWKLDGHQRTLAPIRDLVQDSIISNGWFQLVKNDTRYQNNNSSSCLDHVYARSVTDITAVFNHNTTGYDHNMIGVSVNISKDIIHPNVIFYRNINGITLDNFANVLYQSRLEEVYCLQDVDEAVEMLSTSVLHLRRKFCQEKHQFLG